MRFASIWRADQKGIALETESGWVGLFSADAGFPGSLDDIVKGSPGALPKAAEVLRRSGRRLDMSSLRLTAPVSPAKIICVGLNYADHAAEANLKVPDHPTLFSRFASSIVDPGEPIILPRVSSALDFEGELAVIIGISGRYIPRDRALDHVAGYSCFNDASLRDYQLRTTQWMMGKNFDGTGAFGPYLVTADELPPGASGLRIETRLNGECVQRSSTDRLIFDVATLVAVTSEAMRLASGDVIVTGTPAGVGNARNPKLFMKAGDRCEVEIERIGVLSNPVATDT